MRNSIIYKLIIICCVLCVLPLVTLFLLATAGTSWFYMLVLVAPSVILTACISLYVKKRIIEPLGMLINEADNISCGDLSNVIEYKRNDEIGRLVSAFDHMRSKLYEQQEQQRQFEIERKNFVNSISHDLKTPIASILAHIEALQDGIATTPEEEKQYVKIIVNKLAILTKLSNQLGLSYATPDTLRLVLQNVNCYHWTSDFFCDIKSECQIRGITPDMKNFIGVKSKESICIDAYQFDRALQNVLSNAFRYTKKSFSVSSEISGQNFLLYIENDGVSLAVDKAEKIFDRFYTEDGPDAQGHLGLGLYIAKTIIQSMKGNIKAEVRCDRIIFEIALPVCLIRQ